MVKEPTEGNLPSLEEMRHHELVDLVKKLLAERASKPTPLTNPEQRCYSSWTCYHESGIICSE